METVKVRGPAGQYEIPLHRASLSTRFLQGAGLAAGLSAWTLVPHAGRTFTLWQGVLGLLAASLGGGIAGLVYYATDTLRVQSGRRRTLANVMTLLVYCLVTIGLMLLFGPVLELG